MGVPGSALWIGPVCDPRDFLVPARARLSAGPKDYASFVLSYLIDSIMLMHDVCSHCAMAREYGEWGIPGPRGLVCQI